MPLSPAQLATLKTHIQGNANVFAFGPYTGQTVQAVAAQDPRPSEANIQIAAWYNQTAVPQFVVWRDIPTETVRSLINFANMTPAQAIPTDLDLNVLVWVARSLACQGKQFNLQNLIQGTFTCPMKRANFRNAMNDCLTGLPSAADGSAQAANWTGVRNAAQFDATYGERMYATGTGSSASPGDLVFEGSVTPGDVDSALTLP